MSGDATQPLREIQARLAGVPDPSVMLAGLFAFAPVAFQLYRADGHCLLVNDAFRELFGSEPPPEYNVLRDEIAAQNGVLGMIQRAFAGETVHTPPIWYDARALTQVTVTEGRRVAIEVTMFPLYDAAGVVSHVVCTCRDRTTEQLAREQAEAEAARLKESDEALRASREHLEVILRGVTDGITMLDPTGRLVYANEVAASLVGFASAEAMLAVSSVPILNRFEVLDAAGAVIPADELPTRRALRGERVTNALVRFRDPHGGVIRTSVLSSTPVLDAAGAVRFVVNFFRDVTAEQRAERNQHFIAEASVVLGSSLEYATTLTAVARLAVPEIADWCAVHVLDEAGKLQQLAVTHVDPTRIALAHELAQRYPADPDAPHGVAQVIRRGRSDLLHEIPDAMLVASARDAEHLHLIRELGLRSSMTVPILAHGRAIGAITFVSAESGRLFDERDVAVAEELARRAGLAIDNAQLFESAQRERARAEQANRAKDEFLSTLSHELRTPLNAILGWTRMLRSGAVPEAKRERALETIERNARVQVELIEDILDVSRIITGKLRLQVAPAEPAQLVEEAIESVRPAADARGVRLQAVLDPDAGTIMGDPDRIRQIVWNLLSNSVKFTPKGGRVHVRLSRTESMVELMVSDTGVGIDPAFLPRIFERFTQADSSTTRTHGGLGLGLAIVKHLVELHGGTIEAQSEGVGKGAAFTVRLPITPVRTSRISPVPPIAATIPEGDLLRPAELVGARVLVLDDAPDARDLVQSVLESCGAKVYAAATVAEALVTLRRERPDVILSDIGMPGEDGYALIRKVRALAEAEGGRTPAVALTAYARSEDRLRALGHGFNSHVAKPIEPQELILVVAGLVARGG